MSPYRAGPVGEAELSRRRALARARRGRWLAKNPGYMSQYSERNRERLRTYHREWYTNHRESRLASTKKWRVTHPHASRDKWRRKRLEAIRFLGGKCAFCPCDDSDLLQIDHINGGGRREEREIGRWGIYNRVLSGAPGYRLLCPTDNWRQARLQTKGLIT